MPRPTRDVLVLCGALLIVPAFVDCCGRNCSAADAAAAPAVAAPPTAATSTATVDYNRDIRPILSNTCYQCHGPDGEQRQAGLRLDTQEGAMGTADSGEVVIVPGNAATSPLYKRLTSDDPDLRMPPPDSDKALTPAQIEKFKLWIDQGAVWKKHWSFERPVRSAPPAVSRESWIRNPIDRFVLARLDQEGIAPSTEADRETLLRRVTLDLTGLPPTIEEIDAFLTDNSPNAYERAVDRLLASARYGEHMARYWLDAARYGDTHGLHLDNERSMWPYRQWVIEAFNSNMPFDQFTIEQLAGDLLPNPTTSQRIATGFNRCNVTTSEGGSIDEEFYVRYAVDRVETMSTVWLGLTTGCAVCHDHKYDPITQREFYSLFAFFNSLTEKAMDGNAMSPPPVVRVPTGEQTSQEAELTARLTSLRQNLDAPQPEIDAAQAAWEQSTLNELSAQWTTLDAEHLASSGGSTLRKLDDLSVLAEGTNPEKDTYEVICRTPVQGIQAIRLELLTHESLLNNGPGRAENSNLVLSEFELEAVNAKNPLQVEKISLARAVADFSQDQDKFLVAKAIDGSADPATGWAIAGNERHENRTALFLPKAPIGFADGTILRFRLRQESQFARHGIGRFRISVTNSPSFQPPAYGPWHQLGPFAAADGNVAFQTDYGPEKKLDLTAAGQNGATWQAKPEIKDGLKYALPAEVGATYVARTIQSPSRRKVSIGLGSDDGIKVWLNDQVVLEKNLQRGLKADQDMVELPLEQGENRLLIKVVNYGANSAFIFRANPVGAADEYIGLAPLLNSVAANRTPQTQQQIREFYRSRYWPQWATWKAEIAAAEEQQKALDASIVRALVMEDMPERRQAFVLVRGEYDKKGDPVVPAVPQALGSLTTEAPPNRLGLARWLTDPSHPLMSRVIVNRFWQQYFGFGIVKTSEDFGSQGEWPSHPDLLDWLAIDFVENGWNVKALQKLIVTSATYRQSAVVSPAVLDKDRDNRLLARGPRFRLDAELVRDQSLFISGLLSEQIGSKSAKPYQPAGLWEAIAYTSSNTAKFVQDSGPSLYRRSMYTFWKRTSPPPLMQIFDAPSREACTVRRARTNTPLQALALMNDIQFVEAARNFAQRIIRSGGSSPDERIAYAFRLATSRTPDAAEIGIIRGVFEQQLARFQQDPSAAEKLLTVGESPRDAALNVSELAAWTMIANLILNLDETVTKG